MLFMSLTVKVLTLTTTCECTFSLYYRILIQGGKTHPLIFIVGTNNFIEYLQSYQILIFIYYKFYFIIFIIIRGSLAVNDIEKANLINDFFANIGTSLGRANRNFPHQSDRIGCSVPSVTDITVCEDSVRRKLKAIKPNNSAGPDDIAPKLLKLAEPAIVSPLTGLFSFCAHLGETFTDWKKARLIPVYKKDDEVDTNNYRPK